MSMVTIVKQALKEGKEKRIKAFHGSPHDFDKFSTDNIGTGEGAQAYGRGLYFAESEATAKSYRDALDPKNKVLSDYYDYATRALKNNKGDRKEAIKELQAKSDLDLTGGGNRMALGAIRLLEEGFDPKRNKATMYEVDIDASPDELLDFDTPLKNQPKEMQEKVFSVFKGDLDAKISAETVKRMEEFIDNNPILAPNKDGLLPKVEPSMREKLLESNGQEILRNIATHEPIEQAEALHKAGIKGIKYADAQTRFSTKGKTHNYVIFDDKLIDIAKKYGLTLPVATAVMGGAMTPQEAQASQNTGHNGVSDEQFQALMDEEARLSADYKERGIPSAFRASPELAKYRRSQILPSLGNAGVGLVEDILKAGDFLLHGGLFGKYNRSKEGEADPRTLQDSAVGKAVDNTVFGDPRDEEAIEESRTMGTFLNPLIHF